MAFMLALSDLIIGIANSDIVMTDGGHGEGTRRYEFKLENIVQI